MADPITSAVSTGGGAGAADPVTAIANAAGKLFDMYGKAIDLVSKAIEPSIISARSVADRLQRALPQYRNPFADLENDPRLTQNRTIIYVITAIIGLLILAIIFQPQKSTTNGHQ